MSGGPDSRKQGYGLNPVLLMIIVCFEYLFKGGVMKEMLWILGFIGVYLLLQIYVLPKMGIST